MYRAILHPGAFRPVWEYLMYASRYPSPWGVPNIVPESTLYLKQRKYTSFQLVQFFDLSLRLYYKSVRCQEVSNWMP